MTSPTAPPRAAPVVEPGHTGQTVTQELSAITLRQPLPYWRRSLAGAGALVLLLAASITVLFVRGVGVWGNNNVTGWAMEITNFVWWIGIGHAGTLISAVFLLLRQHWRTSINRAAEAMTLFALASAAIFPLLHMGRPWFFYWFVPYPSTLGVWPQFRSALVWDFVALGVYGLASLLFWYIGMVPDLATLRDRARRRGAQVAYGLLSLGWRGSARHWRLHETTYFLLAALVTALVMSVHTITSLEFATTVVPGWRNTMFPPYFVAGAVFSGLGMLAIMAILLRKVFALHDFITPQHWQSLARLLLASSLLLAASYLIEAFMAWYGGSIHDRAVMGRRLAGDLLPHYLILLGATVVLPQVFWLRRARASMAMLFIVSAVGIAGMWLDRYIIVVTSLERDFLPGAWHVFSPTIWDWATFAGSIGLFLSLMLLFVRFLPVISIHEMRELIEEDRGPGEPSDGRR
jgi:Ni/Fe-hydrogenase subunit HybB-like protein